MHLRDMDDKQKQLVNVRFSAEELKKIEDAQAKTKIFKRTEFIRSATIEKAEQINKGKK